jgi:hypothetical protein
MDNHSGPALGILRAVREGPLRLSAVLLVLTACGGVKLTVKEPSAQPELVGAFMYPFGFRWEEPAWRSFEMSQRLLGAAIEAGGDRLAFWGPDEFKVMRPEDDAAWVASTALPLLTGTAARPDQGIVIRPWAEKRVNSSTQEAADAKGRARGGSNTQETEYIGHVEVIHPATHEVLIEAEDRISVDPFADLGPEADFDPAPPLTHMMERLVAAAVKRAATWAKPRETMKLPPLHLAMTPAAALRWQDAQRPPAELEMARMDPASLDLFIVARTRFLNPSLTDAVAAKLSRLPIGLYVLPPVDDPKWNVSDGEVLTAIDADKAEPQVWSRLKFSPAPAEVKVRKPSNEMVEVLLP